MAHAMNSHISGMNDAGHQGIMAGGCVIPPGGHPPGPHSNPGPFPNPYGGFHFPDIGHMGHHHDTGSGHFVWNPTDSTGPTHPPAIS